MTDKERKVIAWIRHELGPIFRQALKVANCDFKYPEEIMGGLVCRETGGIIAEHMGKMTLAQISSISRGDYSQRKGETEKIYHGYGFPQIDIGSYREFVRSGDWKDPLKAMIMCLKVLEEKRRYIQGKLSHLAGEDLLRAILAAYNCGQGNVVKVLKAGQDVDSRTAGGDYSKAILDYSTDYQKTEAFLL